MTTVVANLQLECLQCCVEAASLSSWSCISGHTSLRILADGGSAIKCIRSIHIDTLVYYVLGGGNLLIGISSIVRAKLCHANRYRLIIQQYVPESTPMPAVSSVIITANNFDDRLTPPACASENVLVA